MSIELWALAIAVVTSIVCGLCGSLLVVNRQAMVSEGLSHAVLPGLVVAFILFRSYESPWLLITAAASGLLMVWATQAVQKTGLVDGDAGLGITFSAMFSLGILLVSLNLRNTHFHADCIIDGNLALASLDRLVLGGVNLGPSSWVIMLAVLALILGFILLCFKELQVMIFDPALAQRVGLRPTLMQYIWLAIVSLATVAAFNVAGSILIVALMIAPPAAAYLLTNNLDRLLALSALLAAVSSVVGFYAANSMEIAPTGPIASAAGAVFLIVLFTAPRRGVLSKWLQLFRQRAAVKRCMALEIAADCESHQAAKAAIAEAMHFPKDQASALVRELEGRKFLTQHSDVLKISDAGLQYIEKHAGVSLARA